MADDVSTGELDRRLGGLGERLGRMEDLLLRLVSVDMHDRAQKETERRFEEVGRDLADERTAREAAIKELKEKLEQRAAQRGTDWRQVLFQGLIPTLFLLVTFLFQILRGS